MHTDNIDGRILEISSVILNYTIYETWKRMILTLKLFASANELLPLSANNLGSFSISDKMYYR